VNIISVDPGVETGYCYAKIIPVSDEPKLFFYPHQGVDDVDEFWRKLEKFQPRFIVMEDWEDRRGARATGGVNSFPVQLIGVARLYSLIAKHQCAIYLQKPGEGLGGFYSLAMLKQLGFYKRGLPHGMSATQHLLQWATFKAGSQYITDRRDFAIRLDEWN
jgi:hypothetical protein